MIKIVVEEHLRVPMLQVRREGADAAQFTSPLIKHTRQQSIGYGSLCVAKRRRRWRSLEKLLSILGISNFAFESSGGFRQACVPDLTS